MYYVDGKVTFFRILDRDLSPAWGPPGDELTTSEAIVKVSGDGNKAFGIELKSNDPQIAVRMAMVSMLREAFLYGKDVSVGYMEEPRQGKNNFRLARVQWGTE